MRCFLSHSFPQPSPPRKLSAFLFLSHHSTETRGAALPFPHSEREMRLCSARCKVRRAQPHLIPPSNLGCWLLLLQGSALVKSERCRESPVSSPHRRDRCKAQFLNRRTEIEIVCRLNDILLLFQMLQLRQLIPPGNTSASLLPLFLCAAWSPGCSLHGSKYCPFYQRITTENLLGSNSHFSKIPPQELNSSLLLQPVAP